MRTVPHAALTVEVSLWTIKINRSERENRVFARVGTGSFNIYNDHYCNTIIGTLSRPDGIFCTIEGMQLTMHPSWTQALATECTKPYFVELEKRVNAAYQTGAVFPPASLILTALEQCPLPTVKVVILGQDPYHNAGQANGLAFSVPDEITIPPSLQNIFKEITADIGTPKPASGNLTRWATQGVLLLNAALTVAEGQAASHTGFGWEQFTDTIIKTVSSERTNVVFLLWGAFAHSKRTLINERTHLILTSAHPSPLSAYRGFIGCKHFSKTNQYLVETAQTPIEW